MNRAVFLDRDGTIIKDRGHINDVKDVVFYNYTFDCLKELQKDFLLFIITNQPGVSKGIISVDSLNRIHTYILHKMGEHGIDIKEIYCCTHRKEDNCLCRKPNTVFIDSAKDKYSIDLENSFVIGDHPSDIELAIKIKTNGIFVLTGHGQKHFCELNFHQRQKIRICSNLKSATQTILKSISNGTYHGQYG
jgi:D-glycero-D-manno-heptose 1,7-bisphosphate phosphatase